MRRRILELAFGGAEHGAHIAPALSIVEIMAVLYLYAMKNDHASSDEFVLSKGHGALAYYTALCEADCLSRDLLATYEENGGRLPGQPPKARDLGIPYAGGSLGLGLSFACGLSLSNRMLKKGGRVYVLLGDGELNEGTVWESAIFAGHQKLADLTAIVDRNSMQSDGPTEEVLKLDIPALWKSCGWHVIECDGHDVESLAAAFDSPAVDGPTAIVAETVKGKGVSFMERNNEWHHNRISSQQLDEALAELDGTKC